MKHKAIKGSLTVEAALVMPLFISFLVVFLYFFQIFMIQEQIQSGITKMGLDLARYSYGYHSIMGDRDIFGSAYEKLELANMEGIQEIVETTLDKSLLNTLFVHYIDSKKIDESCIRNGLAGIDFQSSEILDDMDCINIMVQYKVRIPISFFSLHDISIAQRVKVRGWTGCQVPANYTMTEQQEDDPTVYITSTGNVYHTSKSCSHIKLSVRSVQGIPTNVRNEHGGKYYPCESCCGTGLDDTSIYYITSDGTRYHSQSNCPRIKRTVIEVKLSQVAGRHICKRCAKESKRADR